MVLVEHTIGHSSSSSSSSLHYMQFAFVVVDVVRTYVESGDFVDFGDFGFSISLHTKYTIVHGIIST